jgi:hypothetical protein
MTIDVAIEILERNVTREPAYGNPIIVEATRLGVEALKNLRNQRATGIAALDYQLPGETKKMVQERR